MPDVVSKAKRNRMMSGIRGRDTKPEIQIRKILHAKGFRYRLHDKSLQGKPDLVMKSRSVVIFINGCFWHKHDCHLFKWPSSREDFWKNKIEENLERDVANIQALRRKWRIAVVWECAMKGKTKIGVETACELLANWITTDSRYIEIKGK